MTIGALAHAAGVGVETVRFYQGRGLLGVPRRPMQASGGTAKPSWPGCVSSAGRSGWASA